MSSSQKRTWVYFSLILICTFDIRGKPLSCDNTLMWWNWHAAQPSAELAGRERCLFPEGQAFCVEKLLARWDRGVNCRSITPHPHSPFFSSLPPPFLMPFWHPLHLYCSYFGFILKSSSSTLTIQCSYSKPPSPYSPSLSLWFAHTHRLLQCVKSAE